MSFIFTFSGNALSVFLNGVPETVDNTHPKWDDIFAAVTGKAETTPEALRDLIDTRAVIAKAIETADAGGDVTIGVDCVMYRGRPVYTYLTQRMMEFVRQGLDITPWKNFMEKLYRNPSKTAVQELYLWLEKGNMPLTENGNFLAYKKVRDDYGSFHRNADGTDCWNHIGSMVEMPRNEVDDNRNNTCSAGLHFCSWSYLPSYYGGEGRVVIVEIDPADVVSIPSDYDNAKGRAWRYLVRDEVAEEAAKHAFHGTIVVSISAYDHEWDATEDDEEEEAGEEEYTFNDAYGLYVNADGEVDPEDLSSIDDSWQPLSWPPTMNHDGDYMVRLHYGDLYLDVVYDTDFDIVSAEIASE